MSPEIRPASSLTAIEKGPKTARIIAELKAKDKARRWWAREMRLPFLKSAQTWLNHEGVHIAMNAGIDTEDMSAEMDSARSKSEITEALKSAHRKKIPARAIADLMKTTAGKIAYEKSDTTGWTESFLSDSIMILGEAYKLSEKYTEDLIRKALERSRT